MEPQPGTAGLAVPFKDPPNPQTVAACAHSDISDGAGELNGGSDIVDIAIRIDRATHVRWPYFGPL